MLDYQFDENDAFDLTMEALEAFYKEAPSELVSNYPSLNDLPMRVYRELGEAMSEALIAYEQGKMRVVGEKNEHRATRRAPFHPRVKEFIVRQSFIMANENIDLQIPDRLKRFEEEDF